MMHLQLVLTVLQPDLGSAGNAFYSKDYLIVLLIIQHLGQKFHKFTDGRAHPMPSYELMNTPQEMLIWLAYLQSIAPKEMTKRGFP